MPGERVSVFGGATGERLEWESANCLTCDRPGSCDIEMELVFGLGDFVPVSIAARLGYQEGQPLGPCPERQEARG